MNVRTGESFAGGPSPNSETIRPDSFVEFLEPLLLGQIPSPPVNIFGDRELREVIAAISGEH
jgi:hypothetical protein